MALPDDREEFQEAWDEFDDLIRSHVSATAAGIPAAEIAQELLGVDPVPLLFSPKLLDDHDATTAIDELELDEFEVAELVREAATSVPWLHWAPQSDQVFDVGRLLNGRVITNRLTTEELATGSMAIDAGFYTLVQDLEVRGLDISGVGRGPGAESFEVRWSAVPGERVLEEQWVLPEPLRQAEPGTLVSFRREGNEIQVGWPVTPGDGDLEIAGLRHLANDGDLAVGSDGSLLVLELCAERVEAFTVPGVPLDEMMAASGWEHRSGVWVPEGSDFQHTMERLRSSSLEVESMRIGKSPCCVKQLTVLSEACADAFDQEPARHSDRNIAEALNHGAVCHAFPRFTTWWSREAQIEFLSPLAQPDRADSAPANYLVATIVEEHDVLEAERLAKRSLKLDPGFLLPHDLLGHLALDRGAHATAARHFVEVAADPDSHPVLNLLRGYQADAPKAGRNEPCPCGSGRKFKKCHNGELIESSAAASSRLLDRVQVFLERSPGDIWEELEAVAPDTVGDLFTADLVVFEGGGADRYLQHRSPLLNEAEIAELERWIAARRQLWQVTAIERGVSLGLRNHLDGQELILDERLGSVGPEVGEFLLAIIDTDADGEPVLLGTPLLVPAASVDEVDGIVKSCQGRELAEAFAEWHENH